MLLKVNMELLYDSQVQGLNELTTTCDITTACLWTVFVLVILQGE